MLKKLCYLSMLVTLYTSLMACSSAILRSKTPPDWTLGESAKYPHASYVTATGSGSDAESAKDRAMGNLSKVFESHIIGSTVTSTDTQTQLTSEGEKVTQKQRLVERVNVHSEKVLEGIELVEQWQNTADLTYYALAVINREHVGSILKNEMRKLDKDTEFELEAIDSEKDDLRRIAAYQRVINLQETRSNIQKTLKVIDLTGKGLRPRWSLVELKAYAASSLAEIRVSTQVSSSDISGLQQQLEAAMAHAGFPAVEQAADYTLLAEIELQDSEKKQGWYWLRGALEISLIDAKTGVSRGGHSWSLKASATQKSQLISRFKLAIDKSLKTELKSILIDIADTR